MTCSVLLAVVLVVYTIVSVAVTELVLPAGILSAFIGIYRYIGIETTAVCINIFMEYVPGGSIASLLHKLGKFSEKVISIFTRQIVQGVSCATFFPLLGTRPYQVDSHKNVHPVLSWWNNVVH